MNERILELAKQAGLKKEHGADREYIGDFDWREFADLIVRECSDLLELEYGHCVLTGNRAAESIKKHFGIDFGIEK